MTAAITSSSKKVNFSGIAIKLYAIVALAMVGIIGLLSISLFNSHKDLMATKRSELNHLVDAAYSTVSTLEKRARSGDISEQEAKQKAKQIISTMRYQGQNYFWINDTTPKMIMHPFKPQLNGKDLSNVKDPNGIKLFTEFVKVTKSKGEGYVNYMWPKPGLNDPQSKIAFVKEFKPWGWIIGTGSYIDDIEAIFWSNAKSLLIIAVSIFIFILGASLMLARSINRPMRQITNVMLNLADGNLEVEIPKTNRQDEIGHMEKALQVFHENALERSLLVKRQEELKSENERKQKAALLEMADNFDKQVRTIVTSVSSASEQLGTVTKEMAECTSENKLRVGAITVSMETTNSNVEKVSEASQEMSTSITEISSQMTESNKVTQSAVEEVKRANVVIEGLSEASEAIGNIVKLIQEIAEQTNLLALNATIEAARAGDAGKGFAVVASEVKGLASQTGKATEEIAGQIDTIQTSISEAVIAIDQIDTTIYKLNDISHSIAAAVEEQGYAAGEISSNIVEAAQATKDVFENTNALNSLADQNGTSADTMTTSAQDLNNQINDLGSQVDVFVNNIRTQNKVA